MISNIFKINNIVKIGDREKREKYEHSILIRGQPKIYDEYNCIIIQVQDNLLEFADALLNVFRWWGLREVSRKKTKLKGDGYDIPEGWEIKLEKMGALLTIEEKE